MPWGSLNEALEQIGGDSDDNRAWLTRALLAGDVAGRWRNADNTVEAINPRAWQKEIDWANSRLIDSRGPQMFITGGGARDPGQAPVQWTTVEVNLDDVAANRPGGATP